MPPVRIVAILADGGDSPIAARWRWLRAELLAVTQHTPREVIDSLRDAATAGACFRVGNSPSLTGVRRLSVSVGEYAPARRMEVVSQSIELQTTTTTDGRPVSEASGLVDRGLGGDHDSDACADGGLRLGGHDATVPATRMSVVPLSEELETELHGIHLTIMGNRRRARVWHVVWAVFGVLLLGGLLCLMVGVGEGAVRLHIATGEGLLRLQIANHSITL